jgi:hypothetical protein
MSSLVVEMGFKKICCAASIGDSLYYYFGAHCIVVLVVSRIYIQDNRFDENHQKSGKNVAVGHPTLT